MMIDSGWYRDITDFAQSATWLAEPVIVFAEYGVFALGLVVAGLLWWARRRESATLASVLWVPIAMVASYLIDLAVKNLFAETRPCRVVPGVHTLLPCDGPTDYAFPSNHTVIATAFAVSVFLVNRRWGMFAGVFAIMMAASRVYVGAHYPHDVLAGLILGGAVGACGVLARQPLTAAVDRYTQRRHPASADTPPAPQQSGLPFS
jgi:undecaprenyl-diphosphatase